MLRLLPQREVLHEAECVVDLQQVAELGPEVSGQRAGEEAEPGVQASQRQVQELQRNEAGAGGDGVQQMPPRHGVAQATLSRQTGHQGGRDV